MHFAARLSTVAVAVPAFQVVQVESELGESGQKLKSVRRQTCQQVRVQIPAKEKLQITLFIIVERGEWRPNLQDLQILEIFQCGVHALQLVIVHLIKTLIRIRLFKTSLCRSKEIFCVSSKCWLNVGGLFNCLSSLP